MQKPFKLTILTLFPEMFPAALAHSVVGRALKEEKWSLQVINIRNFAIDKHKTVDDTPYGGGAGMVMRADITAAAIRAGKEGNPTAPVAFLTPAGTPFAQPQARTWAVGDGLILLCGHYEGVDQRVLDKLVDAEISIGDYVLTGGEVAAHVVADAVLRLLPNVLGGNESLHEESFDIQNKDGQPLVEYPHYTRPEVWEGEAVPEVLKTGHHKNIQDWRQNQAETRTAVRRPDLLEKK